MHITNFILYLTVNAFHMYIYYYVFKVFLGTTSYRQLEKISFFVMYLLNNMLYISITNSFLNLATRFICLIIISMLYNNSFFTKLLISSSVCLFSMLLDSIGFKLSILFLKNDFNLIFINIFSGLILFFIAQFFKKSHSKKKEFFFTASHWVAIIVAQVFCMIAVALVFQSQCKIWESIVIITIFLLINLIIFWLYDKLIENYHSSYEKQHLSEQVRAYYQQLDFIQESNEALHGLQHDMKNHIAYLTEYLKNDEITAAKKYLQTIGNYFYTPQKFVESGNIKTDTFLNYKLHALYKAGSKIDSQIKIPKQINYSDFDLCVILGNLLDNVFDAFQRMPKEAKKETYVNMRYDRGVLYIKVSNTYDGKLRKNKILGKTTYLTMKDNAAEHGRGLANVERVVKSYSGSLKISDEDNLYIVEILLLSKQS